MYYFSYYTGPFHYWKELEHKYECWDTDGNRHPELDKPNCQNCKHWYAGKICACLGFERKMNVESS